jgi:hypothetical protein
MPLRKTASATAAADRSRSRPSGPLAGIRPVPSGGTSGRGIAYGPCITMTARTPVTSAPNIAAGIMVSTTATSAASRCSSSATSRQNSRAGPHSCRSLTRCHWLRGLRVCQSLTRSVSGCRMSLSGAYLYRRNVAPADSNRARRPSVPSTRT